MHARPASLFAQQASRYPCEIFVVNEGVEVNGKSIMGIMMLALAPGTEIILRADGEKEDEALLALQSLVESDFKQNET